MARTLSLACLLPFVCLPACLSQPGMGPGMGGGPDRGPQGLGGPVGPVKAYTLPEDVAAAVWTTLNGDVGLAPVVEAVKRAGCQVVSATDTDLVFRYTGQTNNLAFLSSNGDIVIASARPLASLADVDLLDADIAHVLDFIEQVGAPIPGSVKTACLYINCRYYLANPDCFQRLVFPDTSTYDGSIMVPNCRVRQARIALSPSRGGFGSAGEATFRGRKLGPKRDVRVTLDIADGLVFGAHPFSLRHWDFGVGERPASATGALDAITDPTPERILFAGDGGERVIVVKVRPLAELAQAGQQPAPAPAEANPQPQLPPADLPMVVRDYRKPVTDVPTQAARFDELAERGRLYLRIGHPESAVREFLSALEWAQGADVFADLARALRKLGFDAEAAQYLAQALRLWAGAGGAAETEAAETLGKIRAAQPAPAAEARGAAAESADAKPSGRDVEVRVQVTNPGDAGKATVAGQVLVTEPEQTVLWRYKFEVYLPAASKGTYRYVLFDVLPPEGPPPEAGKTEILAPK